MVKCLTPSTAILDLSLNENAKPENKFIKYSMTYSFMQEYSSRY